MGVFSVAALVFENPLCYMRTTVGSGSDELRRAGFAPAGELPPDADPGGIGEVEAYYESHESEHGVPTHVVYLASAGFRPVDVRVAMVEGEPRRLT